MSGQVISGVAGMVTKILASTDLALDRVEFRQEDGQWFLRVYITRPAGRVSVEDCVRVSRSLSQELDATNLIRQHYYLEVSSPGVPPEDPASDGGGVSP